MLSDAKNSSLVPAWLAYIESEQTRDAFIYLVGLGAASSEFECHAKQKGEVKDFRFMKGREQRFAFIPNKQWLLFYFRLPAVRSGRYCLKDLKQQFDSVTENSRGEWTITGLCRYGNSEQLPVFCATIAQRCWSGEGCN